MDTIRVALVGCGYWGQNLIRNFWEVDGAQVVLACDADPKALDRIQRRYSGLSVTGNFADVLSNPAVDALLLATPVSTHHDFARRTLLAGKHVLVEKPMTTSSRQAIDLIEIAENMNRTLMVDHTFLYTGAVRKMKALVDSGELGELLYFDSVRINLGLVQSDTNVVWDLAPHDFSIMDFLCNQEPVSLTATGVKHLNTPYEDVAYVTALFESNLIAHFHVNWLAPVKVRRTLLGGSLKMVVYDDTPVRLRLRLSLGIGGSGVFVIDKRNIMANKDVILDDNALTYEGMAGDLDIPADEGILLNFYERANPAAIADTAAIEIYKGVYFHVRTKPHVGRDATVIHERALFLSERLRSGCAGGAPLVTAIPRGHSDG